MKSTGIVRKIDDLGRVVLPIELRRTFNLDVGSSLEVFTTEEGIVLKKYQASCIFCDSDKKLKDFNGSPVCAMCRKKIGSL